MAHRFRNYARFIQKELDVSYSTALRWVIKHVEEARASKTDTRESLLALCKAEHEDSSFL